MDETLQIMGLSNQVYLTNDLMNWVDWLERLLYVDSDGIIFGLTTNLLCIFDI